MRHEQIERESYVTRRAAIDRLERARAEQQVRDLSRECARLRQIIKASGGTI